ncbi:branched-chain amino acid aminotransferase [Parvicella tangerina]|uniref:branched-chain-amino-acid transaminase n=1 Tax=Parvicella tangerina TaxID=2829795 RepID=A0A916JMT8_9FLAO|nr:branched-chain amino acid aminotransferase [Parvicella tangerina]CAG5079875.1 Branched-chain-amino-acid aminotransferase 2 [Parvicella tangerina]
MSTELLNISIEKTKSSKINELDWDNLPFGRVFSDHMFVMDYKDGQWENPTITPFADLTMSPATSILHYGQTFFEGMKATKSENGDILLFRPEENAKRFNLSAERMCMPEVPVEMFIEALRTLLNVDKDWVPAKEGFSLYIRPFMIAMDPYVGIRPSDTYKFIIFTCPVGAYYSEPVPVKIETKYSRAVEGGTGYAKAGGNYAGSLYPAMKGQKEGFRQLIWTDAKEHKYIEEAGTMNVLFVIDGKIITPASSDTILSGITRRSVVDIARDWGYEVEERKVSVEEVITAIKENRLTEAFGAGTAATIAQISAISFEGTTYELPAVEGREFSNKVLTYLTDYKHGKVEDKFNWILKA